MSLTLVNDRARGDVVSKADLGEPRAREPVTIVRLAPLDTLALDGLADARDVPAIVAHAEDSATALSGSDRHEARIRLVSRAVASERARLVLLEALLDERLLARDLDCVAAIDRLLLSTTKRFVLLVAEHRAACSVGHRPTVVVGHANEIHVDGGER